MAAIASASALADNTLDLRDVSNLPAAVEEAIRRAHDDAVRRGDPTYADPETGYLVFTAVTLQERGECCERGCRHCPYSEGERQRAGDLG
jgi:hypothetical protein